MSVLRTEHFTLTLEDGSATVVYDLPLGRIDNGLAQLVADELGAPPPTSSPM